MALFFFKALALLLLLPHDLLTTVIQMQMYKLCCRGWQVVCSRSAISFFLCLVVCLQSTLKFIFSIPTDSVEMKNAGKKGDSKLWRKVGLRILVLARIYESS